jgi:hypothetical protein
MLRYFSQPYPHQLHTVRQQIGLAGGVGLFIAFFLIVFQPFGSDDWHSNAKVWVLGGYGIVTFAGMLLVSLLTPKLLTRWYAEEGWTVGKEVLWSLGVIVVISLGNMLYGHLVFGWAFRWPSIVTWLLITASVGVIPAVVLTLFKYTQLLRKYNPNALKISSEQAIASAHPIVLIAENAKDALRLQADELLFIESADNYSEIVFWKNQKIQKMLLRGSLSFFENQIQPPDVRRCHRSYIVNLKQVEGITGNAQGYKLKLKNWEHLVPVARKYGDEVKGYFSQ